MIDCVFAAFAFVDCFGRWILWVGGVCGFPGVCDVGFGFGWICWMLRVVMVGVVVMLEC